MWYLAITPTPSACVIVTCSCVEFCLFVFVFSNFSELILLIFPDGSDGKESACNAGDLGSIPRSGRSPGEGNGYPLQYSCLQNSMDRGTMGSQRVRHDGATHTHKAYILYCVWPIGFYLVSLLVSKQLDREIFP